MNNICITIITILSFGFWAELYSQEIDATVTVNMEMLQPEYRPYVQSMQYDVENYLNTQRYTNQDWEGPRIPVEITIVLNGGARNMYSARLLVVGQRYIYGQEGGRSTTMRFLDDKWSFEYTTGAMFRYNPNVFNDFSTLLDFYMLIIIGLDMDTYQELGGTPAYEAARQIFQLGTGQRGVDGYSTTVQPGEISRYTLIQELLDMRYQEFRLLMFDYYVDGLDVMTRDRETAISNIAEIINDMANYKRNKMVGASMFVEYFFSAKGPELAKLFEGYHDSNVFDNLKYLDPPNTTIYEQAQYKR